MKGLKNMNYEAMAVSVSDLNLYIKEKIAGDEALNAVVVKGEISNFKAHYTGHFYFTLKDDKSLIKCIMFKSYAERINFKPKDGRKVIVLVEYLYLREMEYIKFTQRQ